MISVPLVIEDGSNIEDANSYVTLAEARLYASARGIALSDFDDTLTQQLVKAVDYLETYRNRFKGYKTYTPQALQWPRTCVYIDGQPFSEIAIPIELKRAQIQLAIEINNGHDLLPTADGSAFIVSERVDVIETKYSEQLSTTGIALFRAVDSLLSPLLDGDGFLFSERA